MSTKITRRMSAEAPTRRKIIQSITARQVITSTLIGLACCAAIIIAAQAYGERRIEAAGTASPSTATPAAPVLPQPLTQAEPPGKTQVEILTLRPWGFEPKEITRRYSRLLLRVDNRTGLEEVSLRLSSESGPLLYSERVTAAKLDWAERVNLPPGRYVLSEVNNPDWTCTITVVP